MYCGESNNIYYVLDIDRAHRLIHFKNKPISWQARRKLDDSEEMETRMTIQLHLTPKIPCVLLTKLCSFWHSWKNQLLKKLKYEN
jgi:hypothetical protein